ncbi:M67 family metallopeptidase [Synechococcus sp. GFB01]|uniref:M67 family metallopeptidase n=1 Tax=Synechococcus sp. GFB01 TaxID=1662190 RepID=UPI00069F2C9D|nr:M67 family metallopeptidase [Synechococcus sp. GFB01]
MLTVLKAVLAAAAPSEGCALLLGCRRGSSWQLRWIWPCCNAWDAPVERVRRFAIDPREQLLAQKWGRARGLEVLGAAHSHPHSDAQPSGTDLELTFRPALMVILGQGGDCRAWWLPDPCGALPAAPLQLPWRMDD